MSRNSRLALYREWKPDFDPAETVEAEKAVTRSAGKRLREREARGSKG
jgi:hypothetical protein